MYTSDDSDADYFDDALDDAIPLDEDQEGFESIDGIIGTSNIINSYYEVVCRRCYQRLALDDLTDATYTEEGLLHFRCPVCNEFTGSRLMILD